MASSGKATTGRARVKKSPVCGLLRVVLLLALSGVVRPRRRAAECLCIGFIARHFVVRARIESLCDGAFTHQTQARGVMAKRVPLLHDKSDLSVAHAVAEAAQKELVCIVCVSPTYCDIR